MRSRLDNPYLRNHTPQLRKGRSKELFFRLTFGAPHATTVIPVRLPPTWPKRMAQAPPDGSISHSKTNPSPFASGFVPDRVDTTGADARMNELYRSTLRIQESPTPWGTQPMPASSRFLLVLPGFLACLGLGLAQEPAPKSSEKPLPAVSDTPLANLQGLWELAQVEAEGNFLPPGLFGPATLAAKAPDSDNWIHEIKFDGYRLQARREAGKVNLLTRNGLEIKGLLVSPKDGKPFKPDNGKAGGKPEQLLMPLDIIPEVDGKSTMLQEGLCKVEGDKLFLCSGPPGVGRPTSLATQGKPQITVMIFMKKKP